MNDETLASELLRQVKMNAQRWFIAFIVMVCIEVATIAGFLWYISLPIEEIAVESESGNANYIGRNMEGDIYNGEGYCKEKSCEK